ncbi:DUF2065 domain-containing protein [Hydrogenophaga sp. 5NK40-0174]|uniref:DUF2065 domain-containing protein n=1 Tax=Hydrogenophaga sp. 5NK40-0174 TaxID=3127649 RepID=UPI0031073EBB
MTLACRTVWPAMGEVFWTAVALMLIFEGALPLLVPRAWRRMLTDLLQFKDGQLRFYGLLLVGIGAALLIWLD